MQLAPVESAGQSMLWGKHGRRCSCHVKESAAQNMMSRVVVSRMSAVPRTAGIVAVARAPIT